MKRDKTKLPSGYAMARNKRTTKYAAVTPAGIRMTTMGGGDRQSQIDWAWLCLEGVERDEAAEKEWEIVK